MRVTSPQQYLLYVTSWTARGVERRWAGGGEGEGDGKGSSEGEGDGEGSSEGEGEQSRCEGESSARESGRAVALRAKLENEKNS